MIPNESIKHIRPKPKRSSGGRNRKRRNTAAKVISVSSSGKFRLRSARTVGKRQKSTFESFPIVGMGASAGGLEALEKFFSYMPPDSGMAFVLVLHLDPTHESIMAKLLQKVTAMQVCQVEDGMRVEPNSVYVIPPKKDMAIMHRVLHLIEPVEQRGLRRPIDFFLKSLAEDQQDKAIGIVLSGTGTEGTLGTRAIKNEGGMVLVQDLESAKYDGMPRSAIATNLADHVLPPEMMPAQMLRYLRSFGRRLTQPSREVPTVSPSLLQKIFMLIRNRSDHDFSLYKPGVIHRRIERRMSLCHVDKLSDYVRYLQNDPLELDKLSGELVIGATSFFRDKEAFEVLKKKVLPELLRSRSAYDVFRVWVPGCSTGEEAYSIAMAVREYLQEQKQEVSVHVFATDIDNHAIEFARVASYPDSVAANVPARYLHRFFTPENHTLRVVREIREMLVFALHDVIKDPPFSKVDLISCRNLLIYLLPESQRKLLNLFHYSLCPEGVLFLGSSETIGESAELFSVFEKRWRFFRRKGGASLLNSAPSLSLPPVRSDLSTTRKGPETIEPRRIHTSEVVVRSLAESYAPPSVVINQKGNIVYFHGRTGKYLEPVQGEAGFSVLEMVRRDLRSELDRVIRTAIASKRDVTSRGVALKTDLGIESIDLVVKPIREPQSMEGLLLVIFEEKAAPKLLESAVKILPPVSRRADRRIVELERELKSSKDDLRSTIEDLESSNEELKSLNEELQSSNEELQSTNQEMETSREELQSVNEELETVNAELQKKIDELAAASDDMSNLLASTEIVAIFLDKELHIRRFTPAATHIMKFIETDVGRQLNDISSNLVYRRLAKDVKDVMKSLRSKEKEVEDSSGRSYLMRILPYRTGTDLIDGASVTFVDITERKRIREKDAGSP
ncbi:MAG: chemotaxis protein CheB [Candidatus Zixiibacteriota bacterium]